MWSIGKGNGKLGWAVFSAAVAVACSAVLVNAQDLSELPTQLLEKVEAAQRACSDLDDGLFAVEFGAVHRVDLDGDLYSDWVLDEAGFACSSLPSMYCGTGGCVSHFLIADHVSSLLNQGWNLTQMGPDRVLFANVHYSQCGGISPSPCVVASVWDDAEMMWRTTAAEWE